MYLEHTLRIEATPERVYDFFQNLEKNYCRWHNSHIYLEWLKGEPLSKGAVLNAEEWLFGEVRKHKLKLLEVIPGRLLIFTPVSPFQRLFLYRVMFEMEPLGDSATLYRSRVHLRLDAIGSWLFQKYVEAAEIHLEEETENLKTIVESGKEM
jgi:hypothetical protein